MTGSQRVPGFFYFFGIKTHFPSFFFFLLLTEVKMRVCFVCFTEEQTGEPLTAMMSSLFSVVVLFEILLFFLQTSERVMWFCLVLDVGRSLDLCYRWSGLSCAAEPPEIRQNHRVLMKATFVCCTEASVRQTCC